MSAGEQLSCHDGSEEKSAKQTYMIFGCFNFVLFFYLISIFKQIYEWNITASSVGCT